jgi:opacity protein-like surface antigen
LFALFLSLVPALAVAQDYRKDQWEFYFSPVFTEGKKYNFEGGSTLKTDTGYGFGFGLNKNLSPNLALGGELIWGSANYRATVQPGTNNNLREQNINGYIETYTVRFSGTYNVLKGNFTPFVTGGLGWTYIDTNIPAGLPQNVCWYYPYYGQVCGVYTPTQATTRFSYNAGAGVRYDFNRSFFGRAWVNAQSVDFGGNYGGTYWTQARIDLGFKF